MPTIRKTDLYPHEPIAENAIDDLKVEFERLYDIFVATVSRNRYLSESKIRKTQAAINYPKARFLSITNT